MPLFNDTRSAWGARASTNPIPLDKAKVVEFINHWDGTGMATTADHAKCLAFVKAIQDYHMDTRGWSDIGYSGLVCQHGRRIEGRGWNVGAHTADHNTIGVGWCFLAGPTRPVTALMKSAQVDARLATEDVLGRVLKPFCHRDFAATDCPGDEVNAWVKAGMVDPLEEEFMTKEQADALIAAVTGQTNTLKDVATKLGQMTDAVRGLQESSVASSKSIVDGLATLSDEVSTKVSTVVTQSIVESIDESLGGFRVTAEYTRRS